MSKKLFFTILTILTIAFSFTYVFAADGFKDATNAVRNVVGGAENAVENTAKDVSNASKKATGDVENAGKDVAEDVGSGTKNVSKDVENTVTMTNPDDNAGYTATRTSGDAPTFMGMNSTAWTWLILGIAAVVIIGLVWYYSMQLTGNNYDDGNND